MPVYLASILGVYLGCGLLLWYLARHQLRRYGPTLFFICVLLWPLPFVAGTLSAMRRWRKKPHSIGVKM